MARPRTQGLQTREKILEVSQQLFVEQGYDKTSLRDIAERLGISKAALYYYFERKQDIFLELHMQLHAFADEILDEIETIEDGPARYAAFPAMLDRLVQRLIDSHQLMLLHKRNEAAFHALSEDEQNRIDHQQLEARFNRILGSSSLSLPQRVRMALAIGGVTELFSDSAAAFENVDTEELRRQMREAIADLMRPAATT